MEDASFFLVGGEKNDNSLSSHIVLATNKLRIFFSRTSILFFLLSTSKLFLFQFLQSLFNLHLFFQNESIGMMQFLPNVILRSQCCQACANQKAGQSLPQACGCWFSNRRRTTTTTTTTTREISWLWSHDTVEKQKQAGAYCMCTVSCF